MIIIQFRDDTLASRAQYLFASSNNDGAFLYKDGEQTKAATRWSVLNFNTVYGSLIKTGEPNE